MAKRGRKPEFSDEDLMETYDDMLAAIQHDDCYSSEYLESFVPEIAAKKCAIVALKMAEREINSLYYGPDLEEKDIMDFYVDVHKNIKKYIKAQIGKLEKMGEGELSRYGDSKTHNKD